MSSLKVILISIIVVGGLLVQSANASDRRAEEADAYVLLDNALNLSEVGNTADWRYQYQRVEQWSALHEKLTRGTKLSNTQMKMYLFFVFVSDQRIYTHDLEDIDEEIVSIYEKQAVDMLRVLEETPFLLPAVCKNLNGHFEQVGDLSAKPKFIEKNRAIFHAQLGDKLATQCLAEFK